MLVQYSDYGHIGYRLTLVCFSICSIREKISLPADKRFAGTFERR